MIYFDYAATSIKRKDILKDIFENMENFDGNPDSLHALGRAGKKFWKNLDWKLQSLLMQIPII